MLSISLPTFLTFKIIYTLKSKIYGKNNNFVTKKTNKIGAETKFIIKVKYF